MQINPAPPHTIFLGTLGTRGGCLNPACGDPTPGRRVFLKGRRLLLILKENTYVYLLRLAHYRTLPSYYSIYRLLKQVDPEDRIHVHVVIGLRAIAVRLHMLNDVNKKKVISLPRWVELSE